MSHARPLLMRSTKQLLWGAAGIGAVTLGIWAFATPLHALSALLVSAFYFLTLSLAGLAFVALMSVSNAAWHVVLKRVPEAMAAYLPIGGATMLLVVPGLSVLYPWARAGAQGDPLLLAKQAYLNAPFFTARMVVVLGIWLAFAWALRRQSLLQDQDRGLWRTRRSVALSAGFLVAFAPSFCLASFDWLMSLEPRWFSTIFGLYNIGGLLSAGTAAVTVATVLLRRHGALAQVTEAHLHDLGKLLLGFCTLWAYLWLSQYLLIWYANMPEETAYYLTRYHGGWGFLFWANLVLGWALPFLMLLPRAAKRSETNLLWVSGFLLAARWLDLYLMVTPGNEPQHLGIGFVDLAVFAGVAAVFVLVVARALRSARAVPVGDPYLVESLHHHG